MKTISHPIGILIATSEAAPYASTGELGENISTLARSLRKLGHNPSIIIPRYSCTSNYISDFQTIFASLPVPISDRFETARIIMTTLEPSTPVYLVDYPDYYDRVGIYSDSEAVYRDNAERFIFFNRAIIEFLKHSPARFQVLHANDWQTGLIPLYLKFLKNSSERLQNIRSLFTIHNLEYQGIFWRYDMHLTGLPWDYFTADGFEFYGSMNLMKAGLVFSDLINTVSERYLQDILTPDQGCGLDGILRKRREELFSIQNGIDMQIWNPRTDPWIVSNYGSTGLAGKHTCKKDLADRMNLKIDEDTPVVSMISRLNSQKGLDILDHALPKLMERHAVLILMGKGDVSYERTFERRQDEFPDRFRFLNRIDEEDFHRIIAGSDIYLMPSRYEPSGLNQLFSYRYGTIPVVRATGGLHDTVDDYNDRTRQGSGFTFSEYSAIELLNSLDRALELYKDKPQWVNLVERVMKMDNSCETTARRYLELYQMLLSS